MKAGELRVLAVKVAEELAKLTGQTWEVRPRKDSDNPRDHDDRIDIQCGPDAERYITMSQTPEGAYSYGKYDPKINVSGNLPLYRGTRYPSDYQLKAKELAEPERIGVAESRPPATIAKDIKRRLVAPYLAAFDLGRELIAGFHEADAAYEDFSTDLRDNFWLVPSGREHRNHSYRMNLTNGFGTPEITVPHWLWNGVEDRS